MCVPLLLLLPLDREINKLNLKQFGNKSKKIVNWNSFHCIGDQINIRGRNWWTTVRRHTHTLTVSVFYTPTHIHTPTHFEMCARICFLMKMENNQYRRTPEYNRQQTSVNNNITLHSLHSSTSSSSSPPATSIYTRIYIYIYMNDKCTHVTRNYFYEWFASACANENQKNQKRKHIHWIHSR